MKADTVCRNRVKKIFKSNPVHSLIFNFIQPIFLYCINNQKNLQNDIITNHLNIRDITDKLKYIKDKNFILFLYWFLIHFYKKINEIEKVIKIQDEVELVIHELVEAISGFQLKSLFSDKPIIHQMLMEEIDFNFIEDVGLDDFSEPEQVKMKEIDVFNFCIECGFKNDNKFQFCPACGKKITK